MPPLKRDPQTLGERLFLVRNEHELTWEQVAQLLGVSRRQVTDYERGYEVPLTVLVTFCDVFAVRWYWVTCGLEARDRPLARLSRSHGLS